jgi:hypothetical protein
MSMVRLKSVQSMVVIFALGAIMLCAQATNGTISGTVTDNSGGAIAGATVQITNVSTGVVRAATTNAQGRYNVPDLLVGEYEAQVSNAGFQTTVQKAIPVTVGSQRVVDFTLQVGQAQQTVTVEGTISQVDTTSAAVSSLVEQKQISDLPLNGRNYTQLISLAPGVQSVPAGTSGFYGRQANYSVAGSRPEGQVYLLDNTDVQDFFNHGPGSAVLGTALGVEAIAEISTQTNTFSAQFGGSGGAINAVTKSGTNQLHGSLFEFFRNSALDSRNIFDGKTLPPFRQNQFGGAAGGRIKKDKAFFFGNYEALRRRQGLTKIAFVPDSNARLGILPGVAPITVTPLIQQLLGYYPLPATLVGGGVGTVPVVASQAGNETYLLGRVDYTLSTNDSLFGRYVNDRADFTDPFSGSAIPLWPETHHTNNHYATVEERHSISPALLNLARVSFTRTREGSDLNNNLPGLSFYPNRKNGTLNITGLTSLGSSIFLPFKIVQNKYAFADDVYWTHGAHSLKFGVTVQRVQSNDNNPGWLGGQYTFGSLQNFLRGVPASFLGPIIGQDDSMRDFREIDLTPYIHDEWKVSSRLTLNLGVRYGFVTNPVMAEHPLNAITDFVHGTGFTRVDHVFLNNISTRNIDPRLGFAWDVFGNHRTSVRGGFGIFHDVVQTRTFASGYSFNPPFVTSVVIAPDWPSPFAKLTTPTPSQTNGINYDTPATPYQMQWNLNIQRELPGAAILTVGYVASRGVHLFDQRDQNPPIPKVGANGVLTFGTPNPSGVLISNPRINPAFSVLNSAEAMANSVYHSLQVNVNRRFQRNVQGQLAYTWSHCIDNSSSTSGLEGGLPIMNPYNASSDRGNCLFDRRQNLVASSVVALPFHGKFAGHQLVEGWQLSGIVIVRTGLPFTPNVGFDQAGLGSSSATVVRPNLAAGRTADNITTGKLAQWFDKSAFPLETPGTLGNAGRNILFGPGFWNVDFSAIKNTKISERLSLQFRAEFFNILNHPSWGNPNLSVTSAVGGSITTAASTARQTQLALKLIF